VKEGGNSSKKILGKKEKRGFWGIRRRGAAEEKKGRQRLTLRKGAEHVPSKPLIQQGKKKKKTEKN